MRATRTTLMAVVALLAAGGTANAYTTDLIQVTNDPAQQLDPAVSAGKVAWTDLRTGNADIYVYDVESATETQITSSTANEQLADINGNTIVYTSDVNGMLDVYSFDLTTMTETAVVSGDGKNDLDPAVSSQYVVWRLVSGATANVWAYNRAAGTSAAVSPSAHIQAHPVVSGSVVAWEDRTTGNVVSLDLATNVMVSLPAGSSEPDIDGNTIVYTSGGHIFAYDLTTATTTQITTVGTQSNAHVSGRFVVWEDHSGTDADLYGYDLISGQSMALATGPGDQFLHDIDGYDVAYTDNASGNTDIWVIHVTPDAGTGSGDPCDPANGATVLFEDTFTRTRGKPHHDHRTFTAPAGMTDGTICVDVTGVASAEIELNENEVFHPSDFNMQVTSLSRPVALLENNELEVEMRGKPHDHHGHFRRDDGHDGGDHDCDDDDDGGAHYRHHHHGGDDDGCTGGGSDDGDHDGNCDDAHFRRDDGHHDGGDDHDGCDDGNGGDQGGDNGGGDNGGGGDHGGGTCDSGALHIRVVGPVPDSGVTCSVTRVSPQPAVPLGSALAALLLGAAAVVLPRARRRR